MTDNVPIALLTEMKQHEVDSFQKNKDSIDDLLRQSITYRNSVEFSRFFNFIAQFNHYSRFNSMIVYLQNPAVTFFGSPGFWKKFKRRVNKEAKPLLILAPGAPLILAYDVFDTNGELPVKKFLDEGHSTRLFDVHGEFKNEYYGSLKRFSEQHGIRIVIKPLSYFNAGAVTTNVARKLEIYLKEGHSPQQHFSTFCHELAHLLLGHTGHRELKNWKNEKKTIKLPLRIKLTLSQEELEAETVTFLVCKRFGLTSHSAEYLAGYIKSNEDLVKFSYEKVIRVADRIEGLIIK